MIEIGDKVRFVPAAWSDEFGNARSMMGQVGEVTGTVIQVNEEKGWYRVKYELPGCTGFETFKI